MKISLSTNPQQEIKRLVDEPGDEPGIGAFCFDYCQYYLPERPVVTLLVVSVVKAGGERVVVITDRVAEARNYLNSDGFSIGCLDDFAAHVQAPVVSLDHGWLLEPVSIAKPWGQEIWYTGIEARGQSRVTDGRFSIPLPWVLALGADQLLAPGCVEPNLLKILDPFAVEGFGELYFELHEEKQEVYVVTSVDDGAWPEGVGQMRYGFNPELYAQYGDDQSFRQAYLQAVQDYERIRRQIDALLDDVKAASGVDSLQPATVAQLQDWRAGLSPELLTAEALAREAMYTFIHMVPLRVGDVVKVAQLLPHGLLHGVRVVEFQTPVYERKILSFSQKVLTQVGWDTEEAVQLMAVSPGSVAELPVIAQADDYCLELVSAFGDVDVYRLQLQAEQVYPLASSTCYRLIMVVCGQLLVDELALFPEQAALLPGGVGARQIVNNGEQTLVCLLAGPVIRG